MIRKIKIHIKMIKTINSLKDDQLGSPLSIPPLPVSLQKSKSYIYHLDVSSFGQINHDDLHFHDYAYYHITSIITPFITIIFLPAGSAAREASN